MRNISVKWTERGFSRIEFDDRYGTRCSLQMSSLAFEAAIWLGQNEPTRHPNTGEIVGCRMHLTQEDVRRMLAVAAALRRDGRIASGPH